MSKVYVIWYGKVLEGELLDGDYLGMKQVVIPLDGHRPTALFTPEHVYDSIEQITKKTSINKPKAEVIAQKPQEISQKQQEVSPNRAKDLSAIEAFKRENWDQEHNHLRIDKLDEFYKLWRIVMASTDTQLTEQAYLSLRLFNGYDLAAAHKAGAQWQKNKMMEDATEVTVHTDAGDYPYIPQIELYDYDKDIPLAKEGDKYKVVLIKEK